MCINADAASRELWVAPCADVPGKMSTRWVAQEVHAPLEMALLAADERPLWNLTWGGSIRRKNMPAMRNEDMKEDIHTPGTIDE